MAVRAKTVAVIDGEGGNLRRIVWAGLLNGDSGDPVKIAGFSDRSVQIIGTFGVGGTVVIEGTLEDVPANYFTLTDPQGNALSKTAGTLEQVEEVAFWMRPRVTAGDGTSDLTVIMLLRGPWV